MCGKCGCSFVSSRRRRLSDLHRCGGEVLRCVLAPMGEQPEISGVQKDLPGHFVNREKYCVNLLSKTGLWIKSEDSHHTTQLIAFCNFFMNPFKLTYRGSARVKLDWSGGAQISSA